MKRDVIIALDFSNGEETLKFLDQFKDTKPFVKVGMELFYSEGVSIIKQIKDRGHKLFLDLKLHDIPNTVEKTMRALSKYDIDMCNVHASGTIEMMEAALRGLTHNGNQNRPLLIAVTQLTSTSEEMMQNQLLINSSLEETVIKYSQNAKEAGLDGVVCSPRESQIIHNACGNDFLTITPGVRFTDLKKDDQVRITTPRRAKELGSNFIVVGRPITKAQNPVEAYFKCVSDFVN